jgi:hypothetical membrane protein
LIPIKAVSKDFQDPRTGIWRHTAMTRMSLVPVALGILGPPAFFATTQYGAAITDGYNQMTDAVSALSQRGAPHGALINGMFGIAALLQVVLGVAVALRFRGRNLAMSRAGGLIMAYAAMAALIAAFFPMDPIGGEITRPGVLHLVLVGMSALALIAAMILARNNPDARWFATLTWACLAGMFAGVGLSALAGFLGWPLLGVGERLTQDAYLIWLFVLALVTFWAERVART